MKTTNLIARLNEMTVAHTTVICDVVVTRWTGGWEFETVGRKLDAASVEDAAKLLLALPGQGSATQTAARPTRFVELSYRQQDRALWRFVDNETGATVGPHYRTKGELFADLERYASLFGCAGAAS